MLCNKSQLQQLSKKKVVEQKCSLLNSKMPHPAHQLTLPSTLNGALLVFGHLLHHNGVVVDDVAVSGGLLFFGLVGFVFLVSCE